MPGPLGGGGKEAWLVGGAWQAWEEGGNTPLPPIYTKQTETDPEMCGTGAEGTYGVSGRSLVILRGGHTNVYVLATLRQAITTRQRGGKE